MRVLSSAALSLVILVVATLASAQTAPASRDERGVLFWTPKEQESGFREMERYAPHAVVSAGPRPRVLPAGPPLTLDVDGFMEDERVAGLLVIQKGLVRMERYGLGLEPDDHWVSFSMTKSLVSLMIGQAIRDGHIGGIDDPVTRYIPELSGSAYEGVSIRHLLTMSSGVRWSEDYTDPRSDVARFLSEPAVQGKDPTATYMARLPRTDPPGTRWRYNTGETNLAGTLLARAVGRPLSVYLQESIWGPAGMASPAYWLVDAQGHETGGCCVSASLQDWGRLGQRLLEDLASGPETGAGSWMAEATRAQADIGVPGRGYGYLFWTYDTGEFQARGIFGQTIHIDPSRDLIVVILSAWPTASGAERSQARTAFIQAVTDAVDRPA